MTILAPAEPLPGRQRRDHHSAVTLQQRGLSSLGAGVAFLPMMLIGLVLTPFSARVAERVGARLLVTGGLVVMTAGLVALAAVPAATRAWLLAALMMLVGLGGPL